MNEIMTILEIISEDTGGEVEVFLYKFPSSQNAGLEFRIHWDDIHFRHVFTNTEIRSIKDEEILTSYLIKKANKAKASGN